MKYMERKKFFLLIFANIIGVIFTYFALIKLRGQFGKIEIISLSLAALVGIIATLIAIRKNSR